MDGTDQLNMHAFRIQLVEGNTCKYDHAFETRCKIQALVWNEILRENIEGTWECNSVQSRASSVSVWPAPPRGLQVD